MSVFFQLFIVVARGFSMYARRLRGLVLVVLTLTLVMVQFPGLSVLTFAQETVVFGPETFIVEFLGNETGVRMDVTVETDPVWSTGEYNNARVLIQLTPYWTNVTEIWVTNMWVRVEERFDSGWRTIGVDVLNVELSRIVDSHGVASFEGSFRIEPQEAVDAAWFSVEPSLTIRYEDGREGSMSPYFVPRGLFGPVRVERGSDPLVTPFLGMMIDLRVIAVILAIVTSLVIICFLISARRRERTRQLETVSEV